jgi:hypothetical protein
VLAITTSFAEPAFTEYGHEFTFTPGNTSDRAKATPVNELTQLYAETSGVSAAILVGIARIAKLEPSQFLASAMLPRAPAFLT